jgi:hypothetical protein
MPKWSELPWETILTGLVAIYGAVLSTVNLVSQRARDRVTATEAQKSPSSGESGANLSLARIRLPTLPDRQLLRVTRGPFVAKSGIGARMAV